MNTTPNRGKVGGSPTSTPQRMSNSIYTLVAQADVKCKVADLGDTFLKKKKTTPSSSAALYQKVKARGLDVYKFEPDAPQSFYKIMAHYAEWLDHIPLERRHITLIDDLFDFIFENRKYTQVKLLPFSIIHRQWKRIHNISSQPQIFKCNRNNVTEKLNTFLQQYFRHSFH